MSKVFIAQSLRISWNWWLLNRLPTARVPQPWPENPKSHRFGWIWKLYLETDWRIACWLDEPFDVVLQTSLLGTCCALPSRTQHHHGRSNPLALWAIQPFCRPEIVPTEKHLKQRNRVALLQQQGCMLHVSINNSLDTLGVRADMSEVLFTWKICGLRLCSTHPKISVSTRFEAAEVLKQLSFEELLELVQELGEDR